MHEIKLAGFELLQKVGQGGMGVVWKARQLSLDRIVAVKLLPPDLSDKPEEIKRIMTEARTAARLKHPGIVQVYDASEEHGVYFFVMEYVDGYNVGQWIQRKKSIPWKDALLVAEYVAVALDYAWQSAGMIHCDIKPENIMVDQDGTIKVSDLGLSLTADMRAGATQTEILGTPSYMSPEQVRGETDIDCRTDIYALGATLYQMVTGRRMFHDVSDREGMERQITHQVPDPSEVVKGIPAPVCCLIERMLVKDRAGRYASWTAVLSDLRRVQRGLMPAGKPPPEGASTVHRKRVKIRREELSEESNPGRSSWFGWFALILAVGGLAAAAFVVPKRWAEWKSQHEVGVVGPVTTTHGPIFADAGADIATQARAAYAEADAWMKQNPERFEEAVFRFRKVINQYPGTPECSRALEEIKRLRERREQSIQTTWNDLKGRAEKAASELHYAEAGNMLESYTGRWAAQIASNRHELARTMRQKAAEAELGKADEAKWGDWVKDLAGPLARGKFAAAQQAVAQAQSEGSFVGHKADIESLAQTMQGLGALDDRVIQSFLRQTGSVMRVGLGRGEISVRIAGLSGKKVRGRTLDGQAEVLIGYDELSGAERLARLGAADCPEVAIARGVSAVSTGGFDEAEAYFGKAGPLLAEPLLAELGELRTAAGSDRAETVLARVIKIAGGSVGAYSEAGWLAAVNGAELNRERAAQVSAELEQFLQKYGKTDFAIKATPVILTLQQRCDEVIEGKARAEVVPAPAEGAAAVAAADAGDAAAAIDAEGVERALRARNPGLEPDAVALIKAEGGENAGLHIVSDTLRDLTPLAQVKGLRVLHIESRGDTGGGQLDLRGLAGSGLAELLLKGYTVRDISPLAGSRIVRLAVPGSPLATIMPLETLPLVELDISGSDVRDLNAVRAMKLEVLRIKGTKIASLSLLSGMPLRELNAAGTAVRDIFALKGMPLERVVLAQTQIYDFQVLRGMNLTSLDLSGTKVHDLGFTQGMPLKTLLLRDTPIQDVAALKGRSFETLDLSGSQVKDLMGLDGCTVHELKLAGAKLSQRDLAALAQVKCDRLDLSGTGLTSLSFLNGKSLASLSIENTRVKDLSPLRGMPLVTLNFQATDVTDFSPLRGMPLQELSLSGDLRELGPIVPTLVDLRTVNGFDVRERFARRGPGRGPRANGE